MRLHTGGQIMVPQAVAAKLVSALTGEMPSLHGAVLMLSAASGLKHLQAYHAAIQLTLQAG